MHVRTIIALFGLFLAAPSAQAGAANLCRLSDVVAFSCANGARIASVCAEKDPPATEWTLRYHFGSSAKVELEYPAKPRSVAEDFQGGWLMYSGGGGAFLRFANRPFQYTIFTVTGKWGANGGERYVAGVAVQKDGKEFSNFICRDANNVGELGPVFLENIGLGTTDPNTDLEIPDAFFRP